MDTRKLILPAAVFVGGALLGRLIGIRGLMRAGMAALTVANMSETAGLLTAAGKPARKLPAKTAHKRVAHKRSGSARTAAKRNHSAATAH